jgi:hypothetical protein
VDALFFFLFLGKFSILSARSTRLKENIEKNMMTRNLQLVNQNFSSKGSFSSEVEE